MSIENDAPWVPATDDADTDKHHASLYRDNPVTEHLSAKPDGNGKTRRERVLDALYLTAIDRKKPNHLRAAELLLAYDMGKPTETMNIGGSLDVTNHNADPIAEGLSRMIAEKHAAEADEAKPS